MEEGAGKEATVAQKDAQIVAQKEAAAKEGVATKAATAETTTAAKPAEKDTGKKTDDKANKGCCCVIS